MPARRIGQTATFFPEIRRAVMCSSGVSISISSSARPFVASYVRSSVSSFTSLPRHLRRRRDVAEQAELVLNEGCVTSVTVGVRGGWQLERSMYLRALSAEGRKGAHAGIQRPSRAGAALRAASAARSALASSAATMIRPTSRTSSSLNPRIVTAGRSDPYAGCDGRWPLVGQEWCSG